MIKNSLATLFIALFLTGCGEKYWVHHDKGKSEFYEDKNFCIQEANMAYPVKRSPPRNTGTTTNCRGYGYSVNCTTTPNIDYSANIDWNASNRQRYVDECLQSKGWNEQEEQETESEGSSPVSSWFKNLF